MNKEKTMEVLRGMKFMQRKEEAKRRSLYESERREQADGGAAVEAASRKRGPSGPVLLFGNRFPTAGYALSRRSFGTKLTATTDALVDGTAASDPATSTAVHEPNTAAEDDGQGRDLWDDGDASDASGGSSAKEGNRGDEDPTAPSSKTSAKRFHPQGAVRAPKLPKKLTEQVERQARKRRRETEDGADDDLGLDNLW